MFIFIRQVICCLRQWWQFRNCRQWGCDQTEQCASAYDWGLPSSWLVCFGVKPS